ncbi:superfamily I DNA and/or RNA helicase [Mycoplasmopsis mustelae]|uniref:Superfamily I DNA and/or RNA helicase n=1 Tax=Mycoplasmopsis mustelae TaxID=171289 RepID=A0A4R7UDK8_9BACT|nr:DUF4011 domain-containing protein [Mycoplasmopsis mustelae]TDV24136.1 superfamily I DNA and/or RNA helicase [Mycoplasmopsis mustelae]
MNSEKENLSNINIESWKRKLLDISNKNRSINFVIDSYKSKNPSQVKIIYPELPKLLTLIDESSKSTFHIEDYYLEDEDDYSANPNSPHTLEEISERIKLKETSLYPEFFGVFLNNALKNLSKKATDFRNEYSIDIMYLTVGLLKWYEDVNSDIAHFAPLILFPVNLSKSSDGRGWDLEFNDVSNIQKNEALFLKLKEEYQIEFDWNFESDNDLYNKYQELTFRITEKMHLVDKRWAIIDWCYISNFNFSKIHIFEDLDKNAQKIVESEFFEGLKGNGDLSRFNIDKINNENINEHIDIHQQFKVLDSDSSQEVAIQNAILGKSFVLQGPPGTGKSQTITNIITELIARGKKVLFVAEKNTALQVVYNNLKKIGLEKYAIPIHDAAVDKRVILREIVDSIESSKSYEIDNEKVNLVIYKHQQTREILEKYGDVLLKKRNPKNQNLYQYISDFYELRNYPDLEFENINLADIDNQGLDNILELINTFYKAYKELNFDKKQNPWYGLNIDSKNADLYHSIENSLNHLILHLDKIKPLVSKILDVPTDNFLSDVMLIWKYINLYQQNNLQNFKITSIEHLIEIKNDLNKILELNKQNNELLVLLNQHFNDSNELSNIDLAKFSYKLKKVENSWKKFFSITWWRSKKLLKEESFYNFQNNETPISQIFFKTVIYQENIKEINRLWKKLEHPKLNDLVVLTQLKDIFEEIDNFYNLASKNFINITTNINEFIKIYDEIQNFVNQTQTFWSFFNVDECDFKVLNASQLNKKLLELKNNFYLIDAYIELNYAIKQLTDAKLTSFVEAIINSDIKKDFDKIFLRKNYEKFIRNIIWSEIPNTQAAFLSSNLDLFREKDIESLKLSKERIKWQLDSNILQKISITHNSPAFRLLKAESMKKRAFLPFKKVFEKSYHFILDIKPCLLLSPSIVSIFFKDIDYQFDTVIFDEASQIKPESAICSLFRAKQAIVVGDEEQMPATSYFEKVLESDYVAPVDEEDDLSTGYDSLLTFVAARYRSIKLKWHYRSLFEELIYTSNQNIYKDLVTFPNSRPPKKLEGLNFIYAANHDIRKSDFNLLMDEATNLLKEIISTYNDKYSVGFVVFNTNVLDIAERRIDKFIDENPEYSFFFKQNKKEPFFIKNIDGVQGDERDIIVFIIEGKRNSSGRFSADFGAINRSDSGYKRLNVAITRSKKGMFVISNFKSSEVDWFRSNKRGIAILEQFIKNAEYGIDNLSDNKGFNQQYFDSQFEAEVYDRLTNEGLDVRTQIGVSGYRIDLGILHQNKHHFILGIECDGALYRSSKSSRDRDRLRQQVLENRGWNIHRIWSTDWFMNPQREVDKVLNKLNYLKQQKYSAHTSTLKTQMDLNFNDENTFIKERKIEEIKIDVFKGYSGFQKIVKRYSFVFVNSLSKEEKRKILIEIFKLTGALPLSKYHQLLKLLFYKSSVDSSIKNFAYSTIKFWDVAYLDDDEFVIPNYPEFNFEFRESFEEVDRRTITDIHDKEIEYFILKLFEYNNICDYITISKELLQRTKNKSQTYYTSDKIKKVINNLLYQGIIKQTEQDYYEIVK